MNILKRFVVLLILAPTAGNAQVDHFDREMVLFEAPSPVQFSQSTANTMQVDANGTIHLTCYIPAADGGPPENQVWYQQIDNEPLPPERVDSGASGGGRHPSMTLTEGGIPFIAWQDYRHTTAAANYIDNIEIYADIRTDGGFQEQDIRISTSNADHQGDNGFVPQTAKLPDGSLAVIWYDFTRNGSDNELFLRTGSSEGEFSGPDEIGNYLFAAAENPDDGTHWMPSIATMANPFTSQTLVVWGFHSGTQGFFELRERVLMEGLVVFEETVDPQAGSFLDPPRLVTNGTDRAVVAYTAPQSGSTAIFLRTRRPDTLWSEPVQVSNGSALASQPAVAIAPDGGLLVAWQETVEQLAEIHLAELNSSREVISSRRVSSPDVSARKPALAINAEGQTALAWIEQEGDTRRIRLLHQQPSHVSTWSMHR